MPVQIQQWHPLMSSIRDHGLRSSMKKASQLIGFACATTILVSCGGGGESSSSVVSSDITSSSQSSLSVVSSETIVSSETVVSSVSPVVSSANSSLLSSSSASLAVSSLAASSADSSVVSSEPLIISSSLSSLLSSSLAVVSSSSVAVSQSSVESSSSSVSPSTPDTNLAFGKPARQESNFNGTFTADKAVNGLLDDFQHTQNKDNTWWEVDLQSPHAITTIDLYNRTTCCQGRLSNFYVLVSKVPFASDDLQATLDQANVSAIHVTEQVGYPSEIAVNAVGRYVRIQLEGKNFLHIAEVVVKGSAEAAIPTITGVAEGDVLDAGASLTISVPTTDDGRVDNVDLFLNDTLVRREDIAPFEWNGDDQDDPSIDNLAEGDYTLRAVVMDTSGLKVEDSVSFSVKAAAPTEQCDNREVFDYLELTCANSACHGGGAYPLLTIEGLKDLPNLSSQFKPQEKMLVVGKPEESWLYRKMAGTHGAGGGALMPLGAATPRDDISIVADWITNGAETTCNSEAPKKPVAVNPNTLDQNTLFACADPSASRSSPARLRRILGNEYRRASQYRSDDVELLERKAGTYFSTDTQDLSLDPGTVELMFLTRDPFLRSWSDNDLRAWRSRYKLEDIHRTDEFECMFEDNVDDACRASYVDIILKKRALFRDPTATETALIREVLDKALGQGGLDRKAALRRVVFTATLLPGALFRSEIGDENGQLKANELALALGNVLSDFPAGSPFTSDELFDSDPDAQDRSRGRFTAIQKAAEDGSIFDPEVRKTLLRKYAFGQHTERPDLIRELNEFDDEIKFRGEYYLAPNIQKFFREWLDYGEIQFKQSAASTSAFEDVFNVHQRAFNIFITESGFVHSRQRGRQPMLFDALDDVIARVIIETDSNDRDAFRELMTTNRFMVPTTKREDNGLQYVQDGKKLAMIYNLDEIIPKDPNERWRELPERTGVLTHPAWLAAHGDAFEDGPSLVFRGKWIREHLFSQTVPSLEFVMVDAQLGASDPKVNARERVRLATETGPNAQSCIGCHRLMNSLGLPFEEFNHSGFVRAYDRGDNGIDSSTEVTNLPDPALNRRYASGKEFLTALAGSNYARRGFIRQAFRYFMGRDETLADSCTLNEMEAALDQKGSFIEMLEALVASETFSRRSSGDAQ